MGKWTQGPWLYRPQPYDDWGSVRNGDGYLVAVAANPSISEHQYAEHRAARTDPYEANARLIAAAPELVEALRMAVAADTAEDWSRAVDYARKALAKAGVL